MKYVIPFNNFSINEMVGVAEATLIYNDFILNLFNEYLTEFLESDESKYRKGRTYTDYDLSEIIKDKLWPKMPISSILLEFSFSKITDDEFKKKYPVTSKIKNYNGSGGCYPILNEIDQQGSYITDPIDDRAPQTIHLRLEIGAVISDSFNENNIEGLLLETESSITHELNHAYEGWKRITSGAGIISTDVTWALDVNRSKIRKDIWKYWTDRIATYLYWSEKHEVNAMTQEAWPYVKKYDVSQMKSSCPAWRYADDMTKFKADKFKSELYRIIKDAYPDAKPELIVTRMKSGFANQLIKSIEESIESNENAPSISGKKVNDMTLDEFLKYSEVRVNLAGEKLKRRILKLYSLKIK